MLRIMWEAKSVGRLPKADIGLQPVQVFETKLDGEDFFLPMVKPRLRKFYHAELTPQAEVDGLLEAVAADDSVEPGSALLYGYDFENPPSLGRDGAKQRSDCTQHKVSSLPKNISQGKSGDFTDHQYYLFDEKFGVSVSAAWRLEGGRGDGVRILDIERGWELDHEEFSCLPTKISDWSVKPGLAGEKYHGAAVLGILCADADNDFGICGVADRATVVVSSWYREMLGNPFNVLLKGLLRLCSEDHLLPTVILVQVEMPLSWPGVGSCLKAPLEAFPCGRLLIDCASKLGFYVVQAAGNAGCCLDVFIRKATDSIMVGAACPTEVKLLERSNHGRRLDLTCWGRDVVTCGGLNVYDDRYYNLQAIPKDKKTDPHRCYTKSFGGTSSAAAIVAGVVTSLAGAVSRSGSRALKPAEMKEVLMTTGKMNVPVGPGEKRPRPDLDGAIKSLKRQGYQFKEATLPHPCSRLGGRQCR